MEKYVYPCKCNEVYVERVHDTKKGCNQDSRFANKVFGENKVVIDGRCDLEGQNCCLSGCTHKCNLKEYSHLRECQTTHNSFNLFNHPNTLDANQYKANDERRRCWKSFELSHEKNVEKEYRSFLKTIDGEKLGQYIELDGYEVSSDLQPSCFNK